MRFNIRTKNLTLTASLRSYIREKIVAPVEKFLAGSAKSDLPVLDLEVGRTSRHHRKGLVYIATANLRFGKVLLRAEASDEDVRAACDALKDELEREIKHFSGRRVAVERRGARRAKKELHLARSAQLKRGSRTLNE